MTKRILSLLLSFLVIITVFPAVVLATETVEATSAVSDLEYMKRIGVFPDDLVAGEPLTRNDLARIYFRIIVPDLADKEYGTRLAEAMNLDMVGVEHLASLSEEERLQITSK